MTHTTNSRHDEVHPNEATLHRDKMPVHYTDLINQAQSEVGRDIGKMIKTSMQWIYDQAVKFWQAYSIRLIPEEKSMRNIMIGLLTLGSVVASETALASEEMWKDGVLFTGEEIASLEGHKAFKIVFGLEPGKCTDDITSVSEWLKMRIGKLVQTYPGKGDVERVKGDEWYQPNGTKVKVCNKSNRKAVLIGVQFRPE